MYIYIFEDGSIRQSDKEPTQMDFQAISEGSLEVIEVRRDKVEDSIDLVLLDSLEDVVVPSVHFDEVNNCHAPEGV